MSSTGADDSRPYRACAMPATPSAAAEAASMSTDTHGLQPKSTGVAVPVPWLLQLAAYPLPSASRVEPRPPLNM